MKDAQTEEWKPPALKECRYEDREKGRWETGRRRCGLKNGPCSCGHEHPESCPIPAIERGGGLHGSHGD